MPRFGQDGIGRPAALLAARVRDHAVGAEFVAAFNDGDVAAITIAASGKFRLEGIIGLPVVETGDTLLARFELRQHFRQLAIGSRPRDQRNIRGALEDFFAFLLGHAAQHGKALPFFVQRLVIVQAIEDLLLGLVADRAGVVQDQRGFNLRFDLAIALMHQRPNDFFRVMDVHLAAEGLNVKRLVEKRHRKASISQRRVRKAVGYFPPLKPKAA